MEGILASIFQRFWWILGAKLGLSCRQVGLKNRWKIDPKRVGRFHIGLGRLGRVLGASWARLWSSIRQNPFERPATFCRILTFVFFQNIGRLLGCVMGCLGWLQKFKPLRCGPICNLEQDLTHVSDTTGFAELPTKWSIMTIFPFSIFWGFL